MSRHVIEVDVPDVQKRRIPTKHYVYIIHVTWSDNTKTVIYRRYSRFFDFQNNLLDKFPLEAGLLDPSKRVIPFLPGKIYFGRSHVRDVAVKRLQPIEEYCKALINLPANISQDEDVIDFFDVETDDLNPNTGQDEMKPKNKNIEKISAPKLAEQYVVIADYTKEDKWDLNLQAGMVVEVVEKSESGWWFVSMEDQQGWVPSTFLKRKDGQQDAVVKRLRPGQEEKYTCTDRYTAQAEDEVSLETGAVVDVLEKTLDGWWRIKYQGKEGWAPATYLMKAETAHMHQGARMSGVEIVSTLSDISELIKSNPTRASGGRSVKKSRTLERGGSIRPPPRQNSIKNIQPDIAAGSVHSLTKQYVTIADFEDTVGDGISFSKGENVTVVEKTDGGWWYVQIGSREGWIPSTYVKEGQSFAKEEAEEITEEVYANVPSSSSEEDSDGYVVPPSPEVKQQSKKLPATPSSKPSVISNAKDMESAVKHKLNQNKSSENDRTKPKLPAKESDMSKPKAPVKVNNSPANDRPDLLPPPLPGGGRKSPVVPPSTAKKTALKPPTASGKLSQARPISPSVLKKPEILADESQNNPNDELSNVLKSRFQRKQFESSDNKETEPSDNPSAPGIRLTPVSDRISAIGNKGMGSTGEGNLADVLKAKFESRQSANVNASNEVKQTDSCENSTQGIGATKKALCPPTKSKPRPNSPRPTENSPRETTPSGPKFVKPQLKVKEAKKPPVKMKTQDEASESSDLSSILAAKFEARRNSEQNGISNAQTKPAAASKPATLPNKALNPPVVNKKPQTTTPSKPDIVNKKPLPTTPSKPDIVNKKPLPTTPIKPDIVNKKPLPTTPSKPDIVKSEEKVGNCGSVASTAAALKSKFESTGMFAGGVKPVLPGKPKTDVTNDDDNDGSAIQTVQPPNTALINKAQKFAKPPPPAKEKPSAVNKPNPVGKKPNLPSKPPAKVSNNAIARTEFVTVADFFAENEGEVSFVSGAFVEVLQKEETGWWLVSVDGQEGWAPASYIQEV